MDKFALHVSARASLLDGSLILLTKEIAVSHTHIYIYVILLYLCGVYTYICKYCMCVLMWRLYYVGCEECGLFYGLICCVVALPCLFSCTYRTKIRRKFGLAESPASDCITHCFCECCALCQEYRELKNRGLDPSIGNCSSYEHFDKSYTKTS